MAFSEQIVFIVVFIVGLFDFRMVFKKKIVLGVGFESHPCDNMANMKCVPKTPSAFTFLCEKTTVIYLLAFF